MRQRTCELAHAIGPEVEEHHGVAVRQRAHRLPGLVDHDTRLDELVGHAGGVRLVDQRPCLARGLPAAARHGIERSLRTIPAPVAIHGVVATADRRDAAGAASRQRPFQRGNVLRRAGGRRIAAVGHDVHEHPHDAAAGRHVDERVEVALVTVHAAVGDEADEMECMAVAGTAVQRGRQDLVAEEVPLANVEVDARQVLVDDPPGAEVHVSDLGVAHLPGRQAHGLTARDQGCVRILFDELPVRRRVRPGYGVVVRVRGEAPAVEHDQHEGRRRLRHREKATTMIPRQARVLPMQSHCFQWFEP